MSTSRVARRYAKGLFALAGNDLVAAKKRAEMLAPVRDLFANQEASRILRNPVMPNDLKKELLGYALKQGQADDTVEKLIDVIVEVGRVDELLHVVDAYQELIDDAEGVARADVTSAVPLPPDEVRAIGDNLSRIIGKKVEVSASVDPALLGGFVASVGNYRVDMSLRTKLDGLSHNAAL